MVITLAAPPLADGMVCGDWVSGGLINPVNIVRYQIGKPTPALDGISPATQDLVTPQTGDAQLNSILLQTGDQYRTELIRSEFVDTGALTLMAPAANMPPAGEVVTQYAVDLKFSASVRPVGTNPSSITRLDGDVPAQAAIIAATPPQRFVGLTVRLSTRTRVPDQKTSLVTNPRARFDVFGGNAAGTSSHFARVRTLVQEVSLANLGGISW